METRTVVQLTRVVAAPSDYPPTVHESWLNEHFDIGVSKLNDILVAIAVVSGDPAIGPVSGRDFPFVVPFLLGLVGNSLRAEKSLLLLHYGAQGEADTLTPEQMSHIFNIAGRQHGPGHPFSMMGEAMVEARRAQARGRYAHAVLELGMAFEVLIATLVREVGPVRGYEPKNVQGTLNAGLKNILIDHIPKLIGIAVHLDAPATTFGRWHRDAYDLRNRVVHQGYRPDESEASDAQDALQAVIDEVAASLARNPLTADLARLLSAPDLEVVP